MKLADWLDPGAVAARLAAAGMRPPSAQLAADCFCRSAEALRQSGHAAGEPAVANWVPGRIEVFGKHTDYCGGQSILAAAERGFAMIALPRNDRQIEMTDATMNERALFAIDRELTPPIGHWSNYPQTVARRLAMNFPRATRGAAIAFASNLPPSSGMSSSSALVVGTFLVLASINDLENDETYRSCIHGRESLAGYLSTIENGMSFGPLAGDRGVGTFGGSEDHTAILCGEPNRLVRYSFCPVHLQGVLEMSPDYSFAIASSGVVAEKTGSALESYNRVSALAQAVVGSWQKSTGSNEATLGAIIESAPDADFQLREILRDANATAFTSTELIDRYEHFLIESDLTRYVPGIVDARTAQAIGELALDSHKSADRLLKNQTPETNDLVQMATKSGALGASAFGAGFGGSVWALIETGAADEFVADWRRQYEAKYPQHAARDAFFSMRPGPAATLWDNYAQLLD